MDKDLLCSQLFTAETLCNPLSTSLLLSGQVLRERERAAVTACFEASILMRLMANLSLPTPFTEQARFSLERAHCHLSCHLQPCKCNSVQCESLRAGLYKAYVSQGRYVSLRGMRSGFFLTTYLWPQSWSLASQSSPPVMDSGLLKLCRFSPANSVNRSTLWTLCVCFIGWASSLSASGSQELWPVSSTFNNIT